MGLYRDNDAPQVASPIPTRDDIARYQEDLNGYIAQFQYERQQTEAMLNDLREAQFSYANRIKQQDDKISELTMALVRLTNKVEGI